MAHRAPKARANPTSLRWAGVSSGTFSTDMRASMRRAEGQASASGSNLERDTPGRSAPQNRRVAQCDCGWRKRFRVYQRMRQPLPWLSRFIIAAGLLSGALAASAEEVAAAVSQPARRPNVVLIMADDLGWGDVAYHGNPKVHTPALDQLAKDGVVLERFYVAPVCSPTRGSCMTGRDPNRYGTIWAGRVPLPPGEFTLGDLMKSAGYRTGFFGKWHLGTLTPECD